MPQDQIIKFQEQQIELLRRERSAAIEALELAASLGSFSPALSHHTDNTPILQETCLRVRQMIDMRTIAIYLAEEEPYDFIMAYCDNPERKDYIEHEVSRLINDNSFAYALKTSKPHYFLDTNKQHVMLHVISSSKRVLGMLVGELIGTEDGILDTTRQLISVVMLSVAHALESYGINQLYTENNKRLELKVQKRTHALLEANAQLNLILDSIQTGVLLINAQNQIICDANPAALSMLRTTHSELIGKHCQGTICHEPDSNCPFHSIEAPHLSAERTIHALDGTTLPIIENIKEVAINGQRYFLKSFMDISEQKKLEQLKEDVERISRHDLKGPLNGIINLPDIIQSLGPVNEKQIEMLHHIKSSGFKMLKVINMSLDLYKMETGTYTYEPTTLNILPIVQAAVSDVAPLMRALNVSLSLLIDGESASLDTVVDLVCDETLMYSLLANLLTNAVEASPTDEQVTVNITKHANTTVIAIHNLGVIPPEVRKDFFGKYVTFGKKGGTGLGTFSAKLITDTMGGTLSFTTSQATGTTLHLTMQSPNISVASEKQTGRRFS